MCHRVRILTSIYLLKTDGFNASAKGGGVSVYVFTLSVKFSVCPIDDLFTAKALTCLMFGRVDAASELILVKGKGKASSLDIAPLTILNSGTLQPRKWQLTGNDCSTAAHAVAAQSPR